ncbi:hypothetical protein [Nostoc sp.]|uniref:hypothetical protein n=1 Tax=Nostoc sp. TaxID=1180 RepID=UPI002FF628BB
MSPPYINAELRRLVSDRAEHICEYCLVSEGVGWVEERNPTFIGFCWVSRPSTQPTNFLKLLKEAEGRRQEEQFRRGFDPS